MNANTHSTTVMVAISGRCSINIAGLLPGSLANIRWEIRTIEDVQTPLVNDCQRPANGDRKDGERHEIKEHRNTLWLDQFLSSAAWLSSTKPPC